jgi:tellurite methyltransferase
MALLRSLLTFLENTLKSPELGLYRWQVLESRVRERLSPFQTGHAASRPAQLLRTYCHLLRNQGLPGPILDLASGHCQNAIFLAQMGLRVIACDRSEEALAQGKRMAAELGVTIETWQVDLEQSGVNPLPEDAHGAIMVFYYLHRPLIPSIRSALKRDGILIYETYTVDQPRFGRPHNPAFLLRCGELRGWFEDWKLIYYYEGIKGNPERSVAQIVCQK